MSHEDLTGLCRFRGIRKDNESQYQTEIAEDDHGLAPFIPLLRVRYMRTEGC